MHSNRNRRAFGSRCRYSGRLIFHGRVNTFGSWIEANPLVAWYASVFGPAVAFTAAKLFAIGCGTMLYLMSRHRTVAALTLFYLAFAVMPWAHILHTYSNI